MHETELQGDVLVVTLDDGKANAVGHNFVDAVEAALERAKQEAKAILFAGRPGVYSAGFDLKEFENGPEATQALVNKGAHMLLNTFAHPQPVVMASTGHAVAAGAFFLLAGDTRVGTKGEFVTGLNETAIGMGLPVFGLQLAAARLSKRHQTQAVIQAQMFDPAGAVDAGFLDELSDDAVARGLELASKLAELPGEAYAQNKLDSRRPYIDAIKASL